IPLAQASPRSSEIAPDTPNLCVYPEPPLSGIESTVHKASAGGVVDDGGGESVEEEAKAKRQKECGRVG
ncbi:MAG: hypothetical protein LQ341_007360, partial [Variospora aurantia]